MRNILRVFSHEFVSTVTRKSYIIALLLVALGGMTVFIISNSVQQSDMMSEIQNFFMPKMEDGPAGYVDESGIIQFLPEGTKDWMIAYDSEEMALDDLEKGQIIGYYLIPVDYLETGSVEYVRQEFNPFSGMEESERLDTVIIANLLKDDPDAAELFEGPINLSVRQVYEAQTPGQSGEVIEDEVSSSDSMAAFWIPYIVIFLFYIVLMGSSTLMLNSVSAEKSNRMTEILLTSIKPVELLIGKMVGLGLAGLLQTVIWSGTGFLMLLFSKRTGMLPESISLSPTILVWLVVFFVLGYALYGSLMASLGALTASSKEAGQMTLIVIFPLIIPMIMITSITNEPNGILATVLSMIPFTAPVVMPARLAILPIPIWQIVVSIGLLVAIVIFIVHSAAKLFRAQNLLSSGSVNKSNFLKAVLGLRFKEKEE